MPAPKASSAPYLLTAGFAAGLGFGWLAFHEEERPAAVAPTVVVQAPPARREQVTFADLEADFGRWGGYAVWENDLTEFAALDSGRKGHAGYYEIRRVDGNFYFRTIPALTRPLIDHGPRAALPFHFTETQADRERFYRENPGYDSSQEPVVQLPPRPPQRFSPSDPRFLITTRPPSLTPGAGG